MQKGEAEQLQTLRLQNGDLERFLATLRPDDELAVEASGNTVWFRERVCGHVARVIVVAPGQFEVIRRSIKKTDKNDARAIALFLRALLYEIDRDLLSSSPQYASTSFSTSFFGRLISTFNIAANSSSVGISS